MRGGNAGAARRARAPTDSRSTRCGAARVGARHQQARQRRGRAGDRRRIRSTRSSSGCGRTSSRRRRTRASRCGSRRRPRPRHHGSRAAAPAARQSARRTRSVTRCSGYVDVSCSASGDDARIVVRDTGIGIPADQLERIFEEFYQVDHSSQRPEGSGSGYRSSVASPMLLNCVAQRRLQAGTAPAFTVSRPLRRADRRRGPRRRCRRTSVEAPGGVLVVDDEPAVAEAHEPAARARGLRGARRELRARSARARSGERPPDIDRQRLPSARRRDRASRRQCRARPRRCRRSRPVFVTGDTGRIDREQLANARFLSKPIRADELLRTIHEQVGARRR